MIFPCVFGLAPMAGYTDRVFRKMAYEHGSCFAYTEMISAMSVLRSFETVESMLPENEPMTAIQLLGNDPDVILRAALKLNPSWVDINAGCPVKKVVKKGMGGALLKDLERLKDIVNTLKKNTNAYVTVKTRLGWDTDEVERVYYELVYAGVDMVAIHARTVKQAFKGSANWNALSKIRERPVPLFLSGDIFSPEDALKALEISGADGVLIARGAVGNPWIFSQVRSLSESGIYYEPTPKERLETFKDHLIEEVKFKGERKGVIEMRKFVAGYTRGLPNSHAFRNSFMKVESLDEALALLESYLEEIYNNPRVDDEVQCGGTRFKRGEKPT